MTTTDDDDFEDFVENVLAVGNGGGIEDADGMLYAVVGQQYSLHIHHQDSLKSKVWVEVINFVVMNKSKIQVHKGVK